MTASLKHQLCLAGARIMGCQQQQRHAATRPVVVSVWYKNTGAGNQN